jgi:hypothetical protein
MTDTEERVRTLLRQVGDEMWLPDRLPVETARRVRHRMVALGVAGALAIAALAVGVGFAVASWQHSRSLPANRPTPVVGCPASCDAAVTAFLASIRSDAYAWHDSGLTAWRACVITTAPQLAGCADATGTQVRLERRFLRDLSTLAVPAQYSAAVETLRSGLTTDARFNANVLKALSAGRFDRARSLAAAPAFHRAWTSAHEALCEMSICLPTG